MTRAALPIFVVLAILLVALVAPGLAMAGKRPVINHVGPKIGSSDGHTKVTIRGRNFTALGKAIVKRVEFGAKSGTHVRVRSNRKLTVIAPAGTGSVRVIVVTAAGSSKARSVAKFRYRAASKFLVTASDCSPSAGESVIVRAQLASASGKTVAQSGVKVAWSATGAGAVLSATTSKTNARGVATVTLTTGPTGGTSYTVTATDASSHTGVSSQITTSSFPMSGASIASIPDQAYTGAAITPDPVVTYDGTTLTPVVDYTVDYADNTSIGTATVTITGVGAYVGSRNATFAIVKATPAVTSWPTTSAITRGQELLASTLTGGEASVEGSFAFDDTATKPTEAGTYSAAVTFTPTDADNYRSVAGTVGVTVNQNSAVTSFSLKFTDKAGAVQTLGTWSYDRAELTFEDASGDEAPFVTTFNSYMRFSGLDGLCSRLAVVKKGILLDDLASYAADQTGVPVTGAATSTGWGLSALTISELDNRYYYPSFAMSGTYPSGDGIFDESTRVQVPAVLGIVQYGNRNLAGTGNSGWGANSYLTLLNGGTEVAVPTDEDSLHNAYEVLAQAADDDRSLRAYMGQAEDDASTRNLGSYSRYNVSDITLTPAYYDIATNVTSGDGSGSATVTTDDGYLKAGVTEPVSFTIDDVTSDYQVSSVSITDASGYSVDFTDADGTYSFTMPNSAVTISVDVEPVWDGTTTDVSWYNTSDTVFRISGPSQLAGMAAIVNGTADGITQDSFSGKRVILTSDLALDWNDRCTSENLYFWDGTVAYAGYFDVPTITADNIWTPIGSSSTSSFQGVFDGGSHTVYGLYTDATASHCGLFGYVGQGATIKNVEVSGVVTGVDYVGGIAGYANGATFANDVNSAVIYASGGAVPYNVDPTKHGTKRDGYAGGIVGMGAGTSSSSPMTVTGCVNHGTVTCPNCYNGGRAGGIVGIFDNSTDYGAISQCANTAAVTAYQYVGGIVGGQFSNEVSISDCCNSGAISGASSGKTYTGGIAGKMCGPTENCFNVAAVSSTASSGYQPTRFGGIIGEADSSSGSSPYNCTITNCYSTGVVSNTSGEAAMTLDGSSNGNIVGYQNAGATNCYYLSSSTLVANDATITTGESAEDMRSSDFLVALNAGGSAFVADAGAINDGYPVLAWQNDVRVSGVSLNETTATLSVSGTEQLTATVTPPDATDAGVSWSSSDESVATVDSSGLVTAAAVGTATIIVTTDDGGHTATCVVTVE